MVITSNGLREPDEPVTVDVIFFALLGVFCFCAEGPQGKHDPNLLIVDLAVPVDCVRGFLTAGSFKLSGMSSFFDGFATFFTFFRPVTFISELKYINLMHSPSFDKSNLAFFLKYWISPNFTRAFVKYSLSSFGRKKDEINRINM